MPAKFKSSVQYKAFRRWNKSLRRRFDLLKYLGRSYRCPVCLTGLRAFKPARGGFPDELKQYGFVYGSAAAYETFNLEAVSCPACDATDRERLTALYLVEMFGTFDPRQRYHLLEFAPAGLPILFKRYPFIEYRSADLYRDDVHDKVDITDMRIYADRSVDVFLCSHVLEHVSEDRKAMLELHRILKPNG